MQKLPILNAFTNLSDSRRRAGLRHQKNVSPLRISFTGSLKVMGRAVPICQSNKEPELDEHYYSWILAEMGDLIIPPSSLSSLN